MTDDEHEYRRKNDVVVTKIQLTLDEFIGRYERDIKLQNIEIAKIIQTIQTHDDFIKDIKPVYAKGMMALGAAALGTIGIAVHWMWNHVYWGR